MDPTVERYIQELQSKREEVEDRLRNREAKRRESNEIFVTSVKKELEWLEKNKMKYELRNNKFIEETKEIVEDYKAELAKAYQADQALVHYRRKLDKFVQKNYPKIVSQLKSRLFRDYDDNYKRNKTMRDTGDIVVLNKEIRNLTDEIQSKRFELIEEEEKRLRSEGLYKNYTYTASAHPRPYESSYGRGGSVKNPDLSRSRIDNSISPNRDDIRGSHYTGNEDIRISGTQAKDIDGRRGSLDKNKATPPKAVKFAQSGDAMRPNASPEFKQDYGASSFGTGSLKPQTQIQSQPQAQAYNQPQSKAEPPVVIKDLGTKSTGGVQKLNLNKISKTDSVIAPKQQVLAKQNDMFKTDDLDFEDLDDF